MATIFTEVYLRDTNMKILFLLLTITWTFQTSVVLAAEEQHYRDNFINIDRIWQNSTHVNLERVHGVPTLGYTPGTVSCLLYRGTKYVALDSNGR